MHKYKAQTKYLVAALFGVSLWIPALGQQTPHGHTALFDIQHAYTRGEIDVETAALEQFRVLYKPETSIFDEKQIHKCATPAFMFLHEHKDKLSQKTLDEINAYRTESRRSKSNQAQLSYTSPSGKFEILYDTTGTDSVSVIDEDGNGIPDYIDRVAESADSSYRHEVQTIGFTDPIPDGHRYKVFVQHITFGAYGYTENKSGPGPLTEIFVENDFKGFPPNTHPEGNQTGAVYATLAHEFKHAIQYVQNRWRSPSGGFDWGEMDATLMEEVVYDDVNDYYNYIKTGLNSPSPYSASIFFAPQNSTPGSYWHVSWMIYYSENFGNDLWQEAWELIEEDNFLGIEEALAVVLPSRGVDFASSFVQNHLWHFASGSRAGDDDYGFGEKADYPYSNMAASFTAVPTEGIELESLNTLAARYIEVSPVENDNGYIDVAVDFDSSQVGVGLLFYMKNGDMREIIDTGKDKGQVYVPTEIQWEDVDKLGIVVANYANDKQSKNLTLSIGKSGSAITIRDPKYADLPKEIKIHQNYPNPFNLGTNINFELPRGASVRLEVFDIAGRKVRTVTDKFYQLGFYSIPFNANGLSSGVYIYRLRIDDMVFTKKMTLVK